MRNRTAIVAVLACLLLASACGGDTEVTSASADGAESDGEATDGPGEDVTTTQLEDTSGERSGAGTVATDLLAADRGINRDTITVVEVEEVQWPNGSLGCPKPDFIYTQAVVPGIRVILEAAGETYSYHGTTEADLFLCDQPA